LRRAVNSLRKREKLLSANSLICAGKDR
jgi:hypothetical protein